MHIIDLELQYMCVYISRVSMYSINFVAVVNCLENGMVCGHISWLSGKTPYSTQLLDNFRLIELVMKEALCNYWGRQA